MSANNYAGMTTEQLLELFVAAARRHGAGSRLFGMLKDRREGKPPPERAPQTPEQLEGAGELKAIGAALRKRVSIAQVRQMMDEGDLDVRTSATTQFGEMDPEWASSTWNALVEGVPTSQMVALRAGARQPPPSRPTLQEMSDDAVIARFEDAAKRLSATQFLDCIDEPDDQEAKNRLIGEGTDVLREVKARGLLEQLIPLLSSADDTVRFRAAQGCVRIAEPQAVATLEAIAAKNNFDDSIFAKDTLHHWRNGKALVDAL